MSAPLFDPVNLKEFEHEAKKKLSQSAYDYYSSGSDDEITLKENHRAYDRLKIVPRFLRDVTSRDLKTKLGKHSLSFPSYITPMAFQQMAHPDGEVATARAANALGTIMILSTLSNYPMEEVVAANPGQIWFQLYVYKDRELTRELVQRAENAGCKALVLTIDAPVLGRRERDVRNRFQLPAGLEMKNITPVGKKVLPQEKSESGLAAYVANMFDPGLTWKDVEWLISITTLPVYLKGILHKEDAQLAVKHGVAGIVVSNHGGRQLDTTPATIEVLPEIAETINGRIEILIDGGISRGTDIVKALALGATAVGLGRPVLWGLAINGEAGVQQVLTMLKNEFDLALGLCGCASVAELKEGRIKIL